MAVQARIEKLVAQPAASFIVKTRREPAFGFYWHFHPEYQLTLVRRGRGRRFVGDDVASFEPGDLVLTGPNLPHMWCSRGGPSPPARPHEAIIIQFPESVFGGRFLDLPELAPIRRLLEKCRLGLSFVGSIRFRIAARMVRMMRQRGASRMLGLLEILHLLSRSKEIRSLSSTSYRPSLASTDRDRIDKVCRFIADNSGRPLSLSESAEAAHLSVPAFTRFFRRCTGKSFLGYLTELRLGMACRLLIESDRSVAQVCRDAGFLNLSNFNRRFRRAKGKSPREYRRQYGN